MRVILIVIDSFGIGEMPDAHLFGDEGSNTYKNIYKQTNLALNNLASLGLNNIDGVNLPFKGEVVGSYGRMSEKTLAKDTTAGHYEIAGIVMKEPYPVFPNGFDKAFVELLEKETKLSFLGNEVASGTEIIERLGKKHLAEKKPILYTSQDSVLQIAAHNEVLELEDLYALCERVRELAVGKYNVARVIARPFTTVDGKFVRTQNRKDFALLPPKPSMLDKLQKAGYDTVSVGKVWDVFCGSGISESLVAKNNQQGLVAINTVLQKDFNGIMFANLVDTDMLFGHRNDVLGYANALLEIDNNIEGFLSYLKDEDIFIVTADHGCDPSTPSTDHSREYVPLLIYGKNLKKGVNLGTLHGFDNISSAILDLFGVEENKNSFLRKLK